MLLKRLKASPLPRRYLVHPLEALAAFGLYETFRLLPLDWASGLGGWLLRTIGPWLRASERARRNLRQAFPDKSPAEIEAIVRGVWDNLGRTVAEFPHLREIDVYDPNGRVTLTGGEWVDLLREDGRPGFFFSAHIGNWELVALGASQRGVPLHRIYRAANNPLVERLYSRGRAAVDGEMIPKGASGVKRILQLLRQGEHLGMLVDQKMNDGVAVPFFGHAAMTSTALADLALRHDCPVVPARVIRLRGARFRLEIGPPMDLVRTGDRHADAAATMARANALIESWIREHPDQWLWLHNRWPDSGVPQ